MWNHVLPVINIARLGTHTAPEFPKHIIAAEAETRGDQLVQIRRLDVPVPIRRNRICPHIVCHNEQNVGAIARLRRHSNHATPPKQDAKSALQGLQPTEQNAPCKALRLSNPTPTTLILISEFSVCSVSPW